MTHKMQMNGKWGRTMVPILYGYSEIGAHVRRTLWNLICSRHLHIDKEHSQIRYFSPIRTIFILKFSRYISMKQSIQYISAQHFLSYHLSTMGRTEECLNQDCGSGYEEFSYFYGQGSGSQDYQDKKLTHKQ